MIISAFNYTWFIIMALAVTYMVLITRKYKNKTEQEKLDFMFKQSIWLCVAWILYKIGIGLDKEYTLFEFWNELPLQPCNTVIWLSLIASKKNNKTIMAYSFFAGTVFAILAMVMPSPGFYDINFFTARGIGYYGTHWFVVITGILYATLGLFDIDVKAALRAVLFFLFIATCMHFVNMLMRATVYEEASYYYTYGNKDNAILTMVHNLLPVNLIYLIPFAVVAMGVFSLESYIINTLGRLIRKNKDRN